MPRREIITTLVTPAATPGGGAIYDLTSLANVKAELGITDSASDTLLRRYITSASAAASQYCNRVFAVETVMDEIWPHRDPTPGSAFGRFEPLTLSRYPVTDVPIVIENGVTLADKINFRVDYDKGQLVRLGMNGLPTVWPHFYLISSTYPSGFAPIPADLEDAVVRMVTKRWSAKGRDATLKSENIPGVRDVTYWIATGNEAGNMTPDVTDILDNYRVPVTA